MKLNADIIFDGLKDRLPIEMSGPKQTELSLERPEFYDGVSDTFSAGHLYITRAERLPRRAAVQQGVVIICAGDSMQLSYYREQCCMIRTKDDTDMFALFNAVQDLYNRFDAWRDALQSILDDNASVDEMLASSYPFFEAPMFLLDANFRLLAHYEDNDVSAALFPPDNDKNLSMSALGTYLETHELATQEKEPLIITIHDSTTLNVNLFDKDTYLGCLTIDFKGRTHRLGEIEIAKMLANMLTKALLKFSSTISTEHNLFRSVLQDIVDGMPVDYIQRKALEGILRGKEYVCVKMEFSNRFAKLPAGYICSEVERQFPYSIAFERKGAIMCFIETTSMHGKDKNYQDGLRDTLQAFIDPMDLKVGVSDAFQDIYSARLYYHQASAALENGNLVAPARKYYHFQDYALTELIINSLGRMPAELFFSDGMRRLAAHDAEAPVSYLDTLRVYLDQNMSMTKTSAALYVHRSTLLERIARIERELDANLKDPDERLRIQILLKAMKIHKAINENQNDAE